MTFTISGCTSMCPWIGSLNICMCKRVYNVHVHVGSWAYECTCRFMGIHYEPVTQQPKKVEIMWLSRYANPEVLSSRRQWFTQSSVQETFNIISTGTLHNEFFLLLLTASRYIIRHLADVRTTSLQDSLQLYKKLYWSVITHPS